MDTHSKTPQSTENIEQIEGVVIRFVGDSGDGMQLTGTQFTDTSAMFGNDIATFPNYPAEIRAPQGSLYGVSGYQVHIGSSEVSTPGDDLDLLVAMNPAGLKTNIASLKAGHMVIVDLDSFSKKNLEKAFYDTNPLEDGSLNNYRVIEVDMTSLTKECLKDLPLDNKSVLRSKNMFALGMVYWMYHRSMEHTLDFFAKKFKGKELLAEANTKVLKAGYFYAETLELIPNSYTIAPSKMPKGIYKIVNGNTATAWGLLAASEKSGLELYLGSYPITPATDILHELVKHRHFGVKAFQAEDEIAGICSSIGASFAGDLAVTTTSGPGLALKGEALGLAMIEELPLVVIDVQRGGPSTGLPTKTEQSDLLQALFGRNGESPVIVVAASTPANCFDMAFQAAKLAVEHMTPVILLTDGYIANGSEPWKIKSVNDLEPINPPILKEATPDWHPYARNQDSLARNWAIPGTKGLEHRIGGLEKDKTSGNVSYDPENHEFMTDIRAEKVKRVANYIPELTVDGAQEGDLLVVGWGGTYGSLHSAVKGISDEGYKVGHVHFNYINPMPKNTAAVFAKFKRIVVCELNKGQMAYVLRANYPQFTYVQYNKIQGLPFSVGDLNKKFKNLIANN
ncbi:MAG: 2-oxoacid:acceptor oxidoreductase subunit alpha [Flavobacteriales bacterium CG_4_8_14_3_um_filter_35_10]|nr:2-oxoacid:acceptor oxidoreductase subunit alpha [Zetaproteobacteria bacterium]OIO12550.1 MAG: MFS transporter [Flavobacteriaceae bacterium CG1_02_35_72]PIX07542.1 MAG: 2-oxoacid:acceptor oxidoreductase subunit alpha [Flavobacteriales bacterium CG_4_8_14_3_um_filter_35_10]PJA04590.1 MAG: 2-oxoacid:acceptor oxidoreductase subunit alpha [Flavobacteriales bacterium CG_4_10_14_0_2_um_filter_35_18]